ncbi:hypothetical protein RQP46_009317 [Phenoliferia psychrophenolica]
MSYPNQYPQQPPFGQPPQQQYGQQYPQQPQPGMAQQPPFDIPSARATCPAHRRAGRVMAGEEADCWGTAVSLDFFGMTVRLLKVNTELLRKDNTVPLPAHLSSTALPHLVNMVLLPQDNTALLLLKDNMVPRLKGSTVVLLLPVNVHGAPPQNQPGGFQPQQQQYYAPVQVALPRTYLGAFLHPSENPVLPPNEKAPSGQSVDGYNPAHDVDQIHSACKGFGTNEAKVTASVAPLSAAAIPPLIHAYKARHGTDLVKLLEKELGGSYEDVIVGIMRGPLGGDVHWLHNAMKGMGTNEKIVTELLIGRPPSSLQLLRAAFQAQTNKSLDQFVESELSYKTKQGFAVALMGDWKDSPGGDLVAGTAGGQVNETMVQQDLDQLKKAMRGIDDDEVLVASIIFARSPNHLNRLQALYLTSTRTPLTRKVKAHFTGHLQSALVYALEGAKKDTNGAWRDAKYIHKAMDGAGTDDKMLIIRIVRAHWDRPRWKMVQQAYEHKYKVAMHTRVMKETSGDYRDGLLAILNLL